MLLKFTLQNKNNTGTIQSYNIKNLFLKTLFVLFLTFLTPCHRYCIKAKSKPPVQENIDMTDFYDDDYDIDEEYEDDDEEDEEAADDTDDSGTGKVWCLSLSYGKLS